MSDTLCLQDWKEKYIHEDYPKIFEEQDSFVEQVGGDDELTHNFLLLTCDLHDSPVQMFTGSQFSQTRCVIIWWRPWRTTVSGLQEATRYGVCV